MLVRSLPMNGEDYCFKLMIIGLIILISLAPGAIGRAIRRLKGAKLRSPLKAMRSYELMLDTLISNIYLYFIA